MKVEVQGQYKTNDTNKVWRQAQRDRDAQARGIGIYPQNRVLPS